MIALEFRHYVFHQCYDAHAVAFRTLVHEIADVVAHIGVIVFAYFGNLDFGVVCRQGCLFVVEHFLIKLLTVAETREDNVDILGAAETYGDSGRLRR